MDATLIGSFYFLVAFGAFLIGVRIRLWLPADHVEKESEASIKLGVGLIVTMSALVLGLITASAKSSFDEIDGAVKQTAAQILTLDRLLLRYGPETHSLRLTLKSSLQDRINAVLAPSPTQRESADPIHSSSGLRLEELADAIRLLNPATEIQKSIQARCIDLAESLLQERWMIFASSMPTISMPFLSILLFWLAISFLSFGLFAPRNKTVYGTFLVCALSVASAIYLVLELDTPFSGLIRISSRPLTYVVEHLNQ